MSTPSRNFQIIVLDYAAEVVSDHYTITAPNAGSALEQYRRIHHETGGEITGGPTKAWAHRDQGGFIRAEEKEVAEPLPLRFIASSAGYWITLGKTVLWHHYSDEPGGIYELEQVVKNTLNALGVAWAEFEDDTLWRRIDRIEERTEEPSIEILKSMLQRGRF